MKTFLIAIALLLTSCQSAPQPLPTVQPSSTFPPGTATESSVTLSQYEQIKTGMTLKEVEAIVGEPGKQTFSSEGGGIKTVVYSWQGNGSGLNVTLQGDRVANKAQFNLK